MRKTYIAPKIRMAQINNCTLMQSSLIVDPGKNTNVAHGKRNNIWSEFDVEDE